MYWPLYKGSIISRKIFHFPDVNALQVYLNISASSRDDKRLAYLNCHSLSLVPLSDNSTGFSALEDNFSGILKLICFLYSISNPLRILNGAVLYAAHTLHKVRYLFPQYCFKCLWWEQVVTPEGQTWGNSLSSSTLYGGVQEQKSLSSSSC